MAVLTEKEKLQRQIAQLSGIYTIFSSSDLIICPDALSYHS